MTKRCAAALFFILLSACATRTSGPGVETQSASAPETFPSIDWKDPLGSRAPSLDAAESDLTFKVIQPAGLPQPDSISVTPLDAPAEDRAVAFVYDTPETGPFFVEESPPTLTEKELEDLATCHEGEVDCTTKGWSLVTMRSGHTGLLIYAPLELSEATSLTWLEDGVMFVVMGPRGTLTDSDILRIAEQI